MNTVATGARATPAVIQRSDAKAECEELRSNAAGEWAPQMVGLVCLDANRRSAHAVIGIVGVSAP